MENLASKGPPMKNLVCNEKFGINSASAEAQFGTGRGIMAKTFPFHWTRLGQSKGFSDLLLLFSGRFLKLIVSSLPSNCSSHNTSRRLPKGVSFISNSQRFPIFEARSHISRGA